MKMMVGWWYFAMLFFGGEKAAMRMHVGTFFEDVDFG
jgi:hypothetical protein